MKGTLGAGTWEQPSVLPSTEGPAGKKMAVKEPKSRVHELTRDEGLEVFDKASRHYLGISAEEFLRRWDAGEFADDDRTEVVSVWMMLPLAR